jgi:hypothetical protein
MSVMMVREDSSMHVPRRTALRAILFALLCSVVAAVPAAAADIAGVWKGTMETPIGPTETTITIEPGAALAGKVQLATYEARIEQGKIDGDAISFQIAIEPGTIAYAGTVKGDEMTLEVTGTRGDKMSLVAKRQK